MDFYKNQQFHLFYLIQAFAQGGFIHSLIIGSTFWADVHLNILTFIHYFTIIENDNKKIPNMIGKTQILISKIGKKLNLYIIF